MSGFAYELAPDGEKPIGLIVLQADETIERDFRRLLPVETEFLVSRVPSGTEVSSQSLNAMRDHLTASAGLFPAGMHFSAIGYGCTSATAEIGADAVAGLIRRGAATDAVSEPLSALCAACAALEVEKLALLSPYVEQVSQKLREALFERGITTDAFGSFNEAEEAKVVRIDADSIVNAARQLAAQDDVDAVFLSCTNLRTLDITEPLETEIGLPVLSSNQVLAWHLLQLSGIPCPAGFPGRLGEAKR